MNSKIYLIGGGGVGSWLLPSLALLTSPQDIVVIDGDTLEEKNLTRQLFTESDIGRNKAEALAERYRCQLRAEWFADGLLELEPEDWLIVCVDNHAARKSALSSCDRRGCRAIFAANETQSAEAYYYQREWKGTAIDPRVYFPNILTDRSGDPRRAAIGCTGEAQKENVQLVTSNALGAALAGHLFALWHLRAPTLAKKTIPHLPYRLVVNATKMETFKVSDIDKNTETKGQTDERRRTEHDSDATSASASISNT